MKLLAVDIGNSRLKATLLTDNAAPQSVCCIETALAMSVVSQLAAIAAECVVCGVGADVSEFADALRSAGVDAMVFDHSTPLPIDTAYECYSQLGLDRVATACGLLSLMKDASEAVFAESDNKVDYIVADAGTALTLDYVTLSDGHLTFRGGNISAGISLRLKSLHEYTHLLPLLTPDDASEAVFADSYINKVSYGKNTVSAMACGAIQGMQNEIIGFVGDVMADACCVGRPERPVRLVLTGGDASLLMSGKFKNCPDDYSGKPHSELFKLIYSPHLLTLGLREIYYYNRR